MNGYEKVKERKKAAIRRAAFELFCERGVSGVKISDIAEKAGVSPVTIYNHFKSKEALFRDVFIRYIEERYLEFRDIIRDETMGFREKIERLIFEEFRTQEHIKNREIMEKLMGSDKEIWKFWETLYKEKSLPLIMELVRSGQESGEIHPELSMESVIFYIDMFYDQTVKHAQLFIDDPDSPLLRDLVRLFFYGLMGQRPSQGGEESGRSVF